MSQKPEPGSLLTVPEEITNPEKLYVTGNEYLSLPQIDPAGGIKTVNVLRLDHRGLLEFSGSEQEPLLQPVITVDDENLDLANQLTWNYQLDWLPAFTLTDQKKRTVEGEIFAPPGFKGFCYRLSFINNSDRPVTVGLGWQGCWDSFNYIVFSRRPVKEQGDLFYNQWTGSLILEASSGLPLAALALAAEPPAHWDYDRQNNRYGLYHSVKLEPGKQYESRIYAAVNLDADGAGTTAIDLRRHGAAALKDAACRWLENRRIVQADNGLSALMNRNLFFCYFYSLARSLDGEDLVPVTSRSPRYYVSSAFWSRDTLLWSFPAIMIADQDTARELLLTVYRRHISNAGDHAHYVNGVVLYPGFELDQLAAYFLALEHYIRLSGDSTVTEEFAIREGLNTLIDKAFERFDPRSGLYSTFLGPSDDPVSYSFLTYNNALLQRSFFFLAQLQAEEKWTHKGDFAILARELMQAIYDHCMVQGPFGIMFAWSVNGEGKFSLYDNPPGSLQLLAHYGFCSVDDAAFKNTVSWIRSSNNNYFHQGANFEEAGSVHAANPWPMGACNDLLACNVNAVDFFSRVEMDNGFFCESINPATGQVSTGAAFASGAGLLAYALKEKTAADGCREPGLKGDDNY